MESTSRRNEAKDKEEKRSFLNKLFGGEFLLRREMRPWYGYILFVLALSAVMVVSEQRINEKKEKITKLENEYKSELSRLKANNQFIPYEENQILIRKMQERGYLLNEEHNYTIVVKRPVEGKRHLLFFWKNRKNSKSEEKEKNTEDIEENDPIDNVKKKR